MDQVKVYLKLAIKYRFWIALGVSLLLPLIAYFAAAGKVQAEAKKEADAITSASKEVEKYKSGKVVNGQYKPLIEGKYELLNKDVDSTWRKLYEQQAPLLTWPEVVSDRFRTWGRTWPEKVDPSEIQSAIDDYTRAYDDYVTTVYLTSNPFDPVEGTGVVSAPPKEVLLRPAVFDPTKPPELEKVWSAQERLWVQRTMLAIVADVNKKAKDWDSAPIRQINALEVASFTAQDQRSIAKGDTLKEADPILAPGQEAAAAPAETGGAASGLAAGGDNYAAMMGGGAGMSGGMSGGGNTAPETVMFLDQPNPMFKVVPVEMTVLLEQDKIVDYLIALENSPMSIRVLDYEQYKPAARVVKPEKGVGIDFGAYGGGMMMSGYGMMGMGMMGGEAMGGMPGMMGGEAMGGMPGMMGGRGMGGMMGGMPGMMGGEGMGGMMGGGEQRKGTDVRTKDRAKDRKEKLKKAATVIKSGMFDPYYNIVEVKIYGQARFYNAPPIEVPTTESNAPDATASTEEAKTEAPKAEEAKTEAPKTEDAKTEAPKTEEAKTEAPKSEDAKAEAPKTEAPKSEVPKGDDAAKAVEPKSETSKAETSDKPAAGSEEPAPKKGQ